MTTWADCAKINEGWGHSRFVWPTDGWAGFNCEPGITISDITGGISGLWTYPGDWLLRLPKVGTFLELPPDHTGGAFSSVIMFGICLLVALSVSAVLDDYRTSGRSPR